MKEYVFTRFIGPTAKVEIHSKEWGHPELTSEGIVCEDSDIAKAVIEGLELRDQKLQAETDSW